MSRVRLIASREVCGVGVASACRRRSSSARATAQEISLAAPIALTFRRRMRLAIVLACVAAVAGGPYDEPPGGCQAPPDDFEPPPKPRERAAAVKAPPAAARPRAPPSEAEDETLAQQERQLYEQEAADILANDNEDWDAIEREHLSEMWWRDFVRKVAASLTMAFVAWTVYGRYQQLQRARAEGGAAKADGTIECERKPKYDAVQEATVRRWRRRRHRKRKGGGEGGGEVAGEGKEADGQGRLSKRNQISDTHAPRASLTGRPTCPRRARRRSCREGVERRLAARGLSSSPACRSCGAGARER